LEVEVAVCKSERNQGHRSWPRGFVMGTNNLSNLAKTERGEDARWKVSSSGLLFLAKAVGIMFWR